jgi:hypothetical protein
MLSLALSGAVAYAVGSSEAYAQIAALADDAQELTHTVHRELDDHQRRFDVASRRRLLRRRKRRRAAAGGAPATTQQPAAAAYELVLAVVTNPRTPHTRTWIRETYLAALKNAEQPPRVLTRFIVGTRGLSAADETQLAREHAEHADIERIDASDFNVAGGIYSCIDKLFEWFRHAPRAYPGAAWYAKADDDSLVDIPRLVAHLAPAKGERNVYAGFVQYDSLILDEWKHCGWADNAVGAVVGKELGCPVGRSAGPFPFVVGAVTIMGGDLARSFSASPYIAHLVERGRASQGTRRHWDCGYSDVTLGYALASANVTGGVTLLNLPDAFKDTTYGAMRSDRYLVYHHLRNRAGFDRAQSSLAAPVASALRVRAWSDFQPSERKLGAALAKFECCAASWRRGELVQGDA